MLALCIEQSSGTQRSISYAKNTISYIIINISLFFFNFLLPLPMLFRRTVAQSARNGTFLVKGVIEIIFISEILAKFPSSEGNRQWHHIFDMYSYLHIPWCGLLSLSAAKAMREASLKDKDN